MIRKASCLFMRPSHRVVDKAQRSRSAAVAGRLHRTVMCHLKLIPRDIKGAMEDTEDVDVPIVFHEVGNSVMPV